MNLGNVLKDRRFCMERCSHYCNILSHFALTASDCVGGDIKPCSIQSNLTASDQSIIIWPVMLVLGLGLKAKFCGLGLGLAIGWPWDFGLGLRGLSLAKNSRPKYWQTTKFTINFHPLEHGDGWLEWIMFQDPSSLLTVGNRGLVRVLERKQDFMISLLFIVILCIFGMALALALGLWPWPWPWVFWPC